MEYYQQGDVIVEPAKFPQDGKEVKAKERGFVLAEGEHTGHAHVIDKLAGIEFVEKGGMFYIKNDREVTITHEEHKPIKLPPGEWRTRGVKEYDHFAEEARRVQD